MERFDVDCRYTWLGLGCRPEYRGSPFEQQRLPGRDLVRMDVELLRQFGQRPLTFDGGQSHLGLESRAVIPARSSRPCLSCWRAILAAVRQKLHLSTCPNLPSQLSPQPPKPAQNQAYRWIVDGCHPQSARVIVVPEA